MGIGNSLFAKLFGAMSSIEFSKSKKWINFWLETDFMKVVLLVNWCLDRQETYGKTEWF